MNSTNRKYSSVLFLCLLIFMVLSWNGVSSAATPVVENVDVSPGAVWTGIAFNFTVPMQYKSHFRAKNGKLLLIELRSLAKIQDVDEFVRHYKLSWNKSAAGLLAEITYEGNVSGKIQLLLRFQQRVNIKLLGSPNPRYLKIGISPVVVAASEKKPQQPISSKTARIAPIEQMATDQQQPDPAITETTQSINISEAESTARQKEQQLFDEAESAMVDADYRRAVQIYTKLSQSTNPATRLLALEFLGLARERNGQMAHAKAEYENYLRLYPEGESAERVRQRLAGLLTARAAPKERLRKGKESGVEDKWRTQVYGSFSQFYDRDVTYTQADETIINRSALRSDLDINARISNDNFDIRTTYTGGLESDFLEDDNQPRTSSLYIDALAKRLDLSTRIGRQSRSSGGVLGRFDGGLIRWQANDSVAVNLVAGFPVVSTTETDIDNTRPLYGISFDLGTFAKKWDFNIYYITQDVDSIIDRQAVGGEVRYFSRSLSFFSLIDYDISYDELNTALLTANYTLPSRTSFNVSIDYRNSPILTTSSALQGQIATSIEELLQTFNEDEIRQLAQDRTATSRSYIIGVTHPLSEKLQISSDLAVSETSSTPASGGVLAQPGTGPDYFYSLQFVGSSLIKEGDIAIVGLRYSDTDSSNTYSVNINTRYPISREFRVNPRLVVDFRSNKDNDGEQWKFRPLLRLEYTWKRRYHLEIEGGGEWSRDQLAGVTDNTSGYFYTVGYRVNF